MAATIAFSVGVSCGAGPPGPSETDLVLTMMADGFSDTGVRTFFVPGEVVALCEQPQGDRLRPLSPNVAECATISHQRDEQLVEAVVAQLRERGHREVDAQEKADWVVSLGIVARVSWDLSAPYCLMEDSLSGCVAPLTGQNIQIPSGSLLIQLFDREASTDEQLDLLWIAAVDVRNEAGGALGESGLGGAGPSMRALLAWSDGIAQAFEQTPALGEVEQP